MVSVAAPSAHPDSARPSQGSARARMAMGNVLNTKPKGRGYDWFDVVVVVFN